MISPPLFIRRIAGCVAVSLLASGCFLSAQEENLLQDGHFQPGTFLSESLTMAEGGGWHLRIGTEERPAGETVVDEAEGCSEPAALRLSNTEAQQYSCVTQLIMVEPNSDYMLRGKVKTTTLNHLDDEAAGARLCISEANPPSRSLFASPVAKSDSDWHELAVYFNSGERQQVKVLLYLHQTTGTAWFDDVELVKL